MGCNLVFDLLKSLKTLQQLGEYTRIELSVKSFEDAGTACWRRSRTLITEPKFIVSLRLHIGDWARGFNLFRQKIRVGLYFGQSNNRRPRRAVRSARPSQHYLLARFRLILAWSQRQIED
jgi:hypothetical protein